MSDQTETAKADHPWEDTLILAFRDIQWMLHTEKYRLLIQNNLNSYITSMFFKKRATTKEEQSNALERETAAQKEIVKLLNERLVTPPLLAKLDGKAESAAGDAVTANDGRFFLMEFKADIGDKSTEHTKFIGVLMRLLDHGKHKLLINISEKGHYFVSSATQPHAFTRPVTLEARPYYTVVTQPAQNRPVPIEIRDLLNNATYGLTLEQMADYLSLLCKVHTDSAQGDAHPLKVAVASNNGECWPVSDLSELQTLASFFNVQTPAHRKKYTSLPPGTPDQVARLYKNYLSLPSDEKRARHLDRQFSANQNPSGQSFNP